MLFSTDYINSLGIIILNILLISTDYINSLGNVKQFWKLLTSNCQHSLIYYNLFNGFGMATY